MTAEQARDALAELLAVAKQAVERIPAERAAANAAPLKERAYRQGLVDGMEEGIQGLIAPLCSLIPGISDSPSDGTS